MPNLAAWAKTYSRNPGRYVDQCRLGFLFDRTLTPLLKFGLAPIGVVEHYMEDEESLNCACLLEWKP